MDDRIKETPVMRSSWSRRLVIGGLLASELKGLAKRSLLTALHSHMEGASRAFFLDHESMLCLHGADGLQLCRTTWHEIQGDTGLSIGGT